MMTNQITNHEEVRDVLVRDLNGCGLAIEVAEELVISVSTARRYLNDLIQRGWVLTHTGHGVTGRHGAIEYDITERGLEASRDNVGY